MFGQRFAPISNGASAYLADQVSSLANTNCVVP